MRPARAAPHEWRKFEVLSNTFATLFDTHSGAQLARSSRTPVSIYHVCMSACPDKRALSLDCARAGIMYCSGTARVCMWTVTSARGSLTRWELARRRRALA